MRKKDDGGLEVILKWGGLALLLLFGYASPHKSDNIIIRIITIILVLYFIVKYQQKKDMEKKSKGGII